MNPLFIKIDKYDKVHGIIAKVKTRLEDAKAVLQRIEELNEQEEKQLREWKSEISRIEGKIGFIDESFSKEKG